MIIMSIVLSLLFHFAYDISIVQSFLATVLLKDNGHPFLTYSTRCDQSTELAYFNLFLFPAKMFN